MDKHKMPYMGPVKVGPKGQIVIPKDVRDMFSISPGDSLMIMAHPERGIGLMTTEALTAMADAIFAGNSGQFIHTDTKESLGQFADIAKDVLAKEEEQ